MLFVQYERPSISALISSLTDLRTQSFKDEKDMCSKNCIASVNGSEGP